MNTTVEPVRLREQLNVLLVGNNPIELSSMLNKISSVPGRFVKTETAFDTKSIFERLIKFRPNFILIDDNIGKYELNETVQALANNRKTKNVPITVLKNSNYAEANSSLTILDYILKKSLTADALCSAIRNTIKVKRTQLYLYKAYNKRKRMLTGLLRGK
jgi:DNA-binding NarL/FixJ family response regulator